MLSLFRKLFAVASTEAPWLFLGSSWASAIGFATFKGLARGISADRTGG